MGDKPFPLDVNPQLECAETLASRFYTDPAMLTLEKQRIFRRTWQLVGLLNQPRSEFDGVKRTLKRENGVHHFHMLLDEFLR
jgi:hypothetical protein